MTTPLLNDRDMAFMLYEFIDAEMLLTRARYRHLSREQFDSTLKSAKNLAQAYFAEHRIKNDAIPPSFDGEKTTLNTEVYDAWKAYSEAGFLSIHHDKSWGGQQMPDPLTLLVNAYFAAACTSTSAYMTLTKAAANVIHSFGSEHQKTKFLPLMLNGCATGTMAMTEVEQGSSLSDISTYALPQNDGSYLVFGEKIYISAGDQNIANNVIHLVLAKIEGSPAGVGGISLFICPKFLVNDDGSNGQRNDVKMKALLDKMGCRHYINTQMSFGGDRGAVGYLIGEPHQGLRYMFQMMNESRIGVGMWASALSYQSYNASLGYAKERIQGRLPSDKNPESRQVRLIEHADVRRMLLAQKSYSEGGMALCVYASSLFEDARTAASEKERADAFELLDLITPVVKSWPSKYGLKANDMAIQVFGGAGYIKTNGVEQYFRDSRINPIHEGTEGIQGLDLLARKIPQNRMSGYKALCTQISKTIDNTQADPQLATLALSLEEAVSVLDNTTGHLLKVMGEEVNLGLANATLYLDVFGRVVMSWIWLRQAQIARQALTNKQQNTSEVSFYQGKLHTARYYIEWELPEIMPQVDILNATSPVCFEMQEDWFQQ